MAKKAHHQRQLQPVGNRSAQWDTCRGQQNRHRGNDRLTESEYFDIIGRKTGTLTSVSCELGAFFAGADASVVSAMGDYGISAGIAFQIIDDVLDLVGDRFEVGKTLGRDLTMGKLTLPTIHCLTYARAATATALRSAIIGDRDCDPRDVRSWLDETDSIEYAESTAASYVDQALNQLDRLPPGDARSSLATLAEFIVHRRY